MKVGVYFDGFNVYYGGRQRFGSGEAGWKWYSPRLLAQSFIEEIKSTPNIVDHGNVYETWRTADVSRVVFCTARIPDTRDPQAAVDQRAYLGALEKGQHVDCLEYGNYVSRIKYAPLAKRDEAGRPSLVTPDWPLRVATPSGRHVDEAVFMVSYLHNEEKGSDVNLATHLIADVLTKQVEAVVIVSNDSDLAKPVALARSKVPVGVVCPGTNHVHQSLRGKTDRQKGDWFVTPSNTCFLNSQMPPEVAGWRKPHGW